MRVRRTATFGISVRTLPIVLTSAVFGGCIGGEPDIGMHEAAYVEEFNRNCNIDSELKVFGAPQEEDMTDSDACGDTVVSTHIGGVPGGMYSLTDVISVDTHRDWEGIPERPRPLRTGVRFCRCSKAFTNTPDARVECEFLWPDRTGECFVNELSDYGAPISRHWKRMDVTWVVNSSGAWCFDPPCGEAPASYEIPKDDWSTEIEFGWDITSDAEGWGIDTGPGQWEMPGVLWTHTPGPEGEPNWGEGWRRLSSHYLSTFFGRETWRTSSAASAVYVPALVAGDACISCEWEFPTPGLSFPSCVGQPGCPYGPEIRAAQGAQDATSFFAPGALTNLARIPGTWIAAAESHHLLSGGGPRFAVVATDGTAVNAFFTQTNSGLARTIPSQGGSPPPPRGEFGAVVSDEQGAVFVVGGMDRSGAPTWDLFEFDLRTQQWQQKRLQGGVRPEIVLAATYAPDENHLLVLDRTVATPTTIRLLRVSPSGGTPRVVASWPQTTTSVTTFALAVEPWGEAYVVACSGGTVGHNLLRMVRTWRTVSIEGEVVGSGPMAGPHLRTSTLGTSFYVPSSPGPIPHGYLTEDFAPAGPSAAELCF